MAATIPGTVAHRRRSRVRAGPDRHRHRPPGSRGPAPPYTQPPPRCSPPWTANGTAWPATGLPRQLPLDNNTAERALRNSVIGRKNFYGSGARWAADLAADVWTITATAAQNGLEPLPLLQGYLTACAQAGGTAPAGAELEPFLPWTPQGRARRAVPAGTRRGPGP